ncbi:MAG: DUF4199 domain-containing protein [Saprospiraceae bacterium]|nr:DUF4199 domain-containing protein [Saprospiraceae bacterium]
MKQTAIKYGIIAGIVSALYLLVFHQMGAQFALNPFVVFGQIFISMLAMALAVRKIRTDNGDTIAKPDALKYAFLVFVLSQLLFWLFIYMLFNFIDTNLVEIQRKMMNDAGIKTQGMDLSMTLGMVFKRWAFMLLPGFMISLMVAYLMKK